MLIRYFRNRKGFTLKSLARKAGGLSYTFLSNAETGKTDISLGTLRRIAKALGVTVCDLVEERTEYKRRSRVTYKDMYAVSYNNLLSISKRQGKLEAMFNTLICEVRDKPPKNKSQSDRYWYKATEISREIWRIREGRK